MNFPLTFSCIGAASFGTVIGWITRYILAFAKNLTTNSLATIIGALGGAAITTLFGTKSWLFPSYSLGLGIGFFLHVLLYDIDADTGAVAYHPDLRNPVTTRTKSPTP